jgi:hypothetical protein
MILVIVSVIIPRNKITIIPTIKYLTARGITDKPRVVKPEEIPVHTNNSPALACGKRPVIG